MKKLLGLLITIFATLLISHSASAFTTEVSATLDGDPTIVYGGTTVGATFDINVKNGTTPVKTKTQYVWFLIRDGIDLGYSSPTHNGNGSGYSNGWQSQAWPDYQWISLGGTLSENTNFWRDLAAHPTPVSGTGYKHAKFGLCEYFWEFTGGAVENGYGYFPYSDNYWTTRGGNSVLAECHQAEMRDDDEIPLGTAAITSRNLNKHVSITIPDVKAGYKLCVASGINFSDSAAVDNNQYRWHISGASCATIAKKPSFAAWNGGVYAPGGIATSTSPKTANAGNQSTGEAAGRLFGSWSEYYVVSSGQITGFASAAGLGYARNNMNTLGSANYNTSFCELSRLTIGNYNCPVGTAGEYGGENLSILSYIDELKTKYSADANGVEFHDGDYTTGQISNISGTYVIRATGDVYINGDICVFGTPSSSGCVSSGAYSNFLGLQSDEGNAYSSAVDIPQVLIIARNIYISPDVTQLDAWLITDEGGEINTCGSSNIVSSSALCYKTLKVNGPVYTSNLHLTRTGGAWPGLSGDIGNPNEAQNLYYGGNVREGNKIFRDLTCDGSITPAEIFDLHPAAMLWAFYQENTLSRAYVTSLQELAPRY